MANALTDRIAARVVMCDGGMGTQLMAAGLTTGGCGVLWNVHHPELIEQIHRRYCDAGCELITTNTFQGSRTALGMHSLSDRAAELNRAGAVVAKRAAIAADGDEPPLVMADIGPFGGFLEPLGDTTPQQLTAIFSEQLEAMREGGADGVIVETMSDPQELAVAVRTARAMGDWPIIAMFAFEKAGDASGNSFHTMMGTKPADAMAAAIEAGADVVGTNCGTSLSLDDYAQLAKQLVEAAGGKPVIVQPNAGAPQMIDGQSVHPAGPGEMAAIVPRLIDVGVRVIGGCCGTTPEHLKAMAAAR